MGNRSSSSNVAESVAPEPDPEPQPDSGSKKPNRLKSHRKNREKHDNADSVELGLAEDSAPDIYCGGDMVLSNRRSGSKKDYGKSARATPETVVVESSKSKSKSSRRKNRNVNNCQRRVKQSSSMVYFQAGDNLYAPERDQLYLEDETAATCSEVNDYVVQMSDRDQYVELDPSQVEYMEGNVGGAAYAYADEVYLEDFGATGDLQFSDELGYDNFEEEYYETEAVEGEYDDAEEDDDDYEYDDEGDSDDTDTDSDSSDSEADDDDDDDDTTSDDDDEEDDDEDDDDDDSEEEDESDESDDDDDDDDSSSDSDEDEDDDEEDDDDEEEEEDDDEEEEEEEEEDDDDDADDDEYDDEEAYEPYEDEEDDVYEGAFPNSEVLYQDDDANYAAESED